MAGRLALGRDEVDRLTLGSKGQSNDPGQELIQLEKPPQPTHHSACNWEHQLLRGATEGVNEVKVERGSADRMCSSPSTTIPSFHTLYMLM